ncbi:MAG: rod shape-determining protein MreC [Planctomycetes bacterium]|nr:rod shape-determining protein MreC [Planctomycetota bacterium]
MSRNNRKRHSSRRTILIVLILISAVGFLLPRRLTGKLLNLVQVIAPLQDWTTRSVDAAVGAVSSDGPAISGTEAAALRRENAALSHRLASLSGDYEDLNQAYLAATHIRTRGLDQGRLIPARVVAGDAFAWRASRLINAGTLSGVRQSAAVASHHFSMRTDNPDALRKGLSVLCGETLVGFVDQVGTHSARVRLLTDKSTALKVLVARAEKDSYYPLSSEFWLVGTGGESMEIRDVSHTYIESSDDEKNIQVGDVVFTSRQDPTLPASMTIGKITDIRKDLQHSLLYILTVEPPVKPADLRQVFVVDLGPSDSP